VRAVAQRIAQQFRHDRRSLGLLIVAPILVLSLVGALWGSNTSQRTKVIVATDGRLPAQVIDALRRVDTLDITTDTPEGAMRQLRDAKADAVVSGRVGVVRTEIVITL